MDAEPVKHDVDIHEKIKNLHHMRKRDRIVIGVLIVSIIVICVAGSASYYFFIKQIAYIRGVQEDQYKEHLLTNQFLLSTIDWSSFRTKMVLFMRDQIIREWRRTKIRVDSDEAYRISESIMRECEYFPYMDPFIILAMQNVESTFRKDMVSPTGALGLNQIMPSTGRLLSGYIGMSYSDSLLYDIKTSTHMAVKLIDVLFAQYNRWDWVLADYNGGPWQAFYFRKDKSKLSIETSGYVPTVMAKKKEYAEEFKLYRVDSKLISYNSDTTLQGR